MSSRVRARSASRSLLIRDGKKTPQMKTRAPAASPIAPAPVSSGSEKSPDLSVPSVVTIRWLYQHVPVRLWVGGATAIVVAFTAGIGSRNLESIANNVIGRIVDTRSAESADKTTKNTAGGDVVAEIGLKAIEYGQFTTDENNRLKANIRNARNIKVLVTNGDNLFQIFKDEFREFFSRPASSMDVLLATADSEFYRQETEMTRLSSVPDDPAYKANQGKVEFNRKRLIGLALDPSQIKFKYFDTQYRLPIIIFDDKYCHVTLRLSPNESPQSPRFEFEGGNKGFSQSCVVHFNRMWAVSSFSPNKR